jgi:hypothetical protein
MRSAQRKALVIDISDYTNLQKIGFCKNDGTAIYKVLSSLGCEISNKCKLIGEAKGEKEIFFLLSLLIVMQIPKPSKRLDRI